ncbi:adhesion G-protein coupled receptor D1-like isoform X2 [Homarus americanus]|nr:adhesion G-protein coupled receptor D1-like isoform X2 [Homarus americanus]
MAAIKNNNNFKLSNLFLRGLKPNTERSGKLLLVEAIVLGRDKIVDLLLKNCADPEKTDKLGRSASTLVQKPEYAYLKAKFQDVYSQCHCQSASEEFLDPEGYIDTAYLKLGKLGEEVKINCSLKDSSSSTWVCTRGGNWVLVSGCEKKNVSVTESTYSHTTETSLSRDDGLAVTLSPDNQLLVCIKESKCITNLILIETCMRCYELKQHATRVNNCRQLCYDVAKQCSGPWNDCKDKHYRLDKLFEAIETNNISAVRDLLEEGVNINNIIKGMTPLVLAVKLNQIALVNLLLTRCPDRSLSVTTGMNATTIAQNEEYTNLTDILEDQSWCQYCPPEERLRCVEQVPLKLKDKSKLVNITEELDDLESEFVNDFEAAGSVEKRQTIAETYMKTVLEVVDRSEPETWVKVDEETCANTSTKLQKSVTRAALAIASTLQNSTITIPSSSTYTTISRQDPSYFTPENRTYRHQNSPNTVIELPENFYENYIDEDGLLTVIFYSYNDLHCATNSIPCNPNVTVPSRVSKANQVNSVIIGATVTESGAWTAVDGEGVRIHFDHIYKNDDSYNLGKASCVWWNEDTNRWSNERCSLISQTENYTICTCDHLTNLAVIMDIHGVLDENIQEILRWWTIIGCSLSMLCLTMCITCLSLAVKAIKNQSGSCIISIHRHLCVCLLVAELVLLSGLDATHDTIGCIVVAALLHYFFLATFTWSAIEGVNLYLMLGAIFRTFEPVKYFWCVGYGFPLLFVGITLIATQTHGYGTERACWLEPKGLIWTFAGPVAIIMLVNLTFFMFAMRVACGKRQIGNSSIKNSRVKLKGSFALILILGLTWITGFFYVTKGSQALAIIFTILNSLQGVGIFVTMVCLNEKVLEAVTSIPAIRRVLRSFNYGSYWSEQFFNNAKFVGGATDGSKGVTFMVYQRLHLPLTFLKSWFFFEDVIFAMASDITLPASNHATDGDTVITTLTQVAFEGEYVLGKEGGEAGDGPPPGGLPAWLHHRDVGYVFLHDQQHPLFTPALTHTHENKDLNVFIAWLVHGLYHPGRSLDLRCSASL